MRSTLFRSLASAVLLLASAGIAGAGVHGHPTSTVNDVTPIALSDWLAAQGTNIVAFQGRTSSKPFAPLGDVSVVDYAGGRAALRNLSYGFTATGSVTLTTFQDGTGEVAVDESFTNAINWTTDANGVLIFGEQPVDLQNNGGTPGLASGHLQAIYLVPDASHPALDLFNVVFQGGGTLEQLKFYSDGQGPLRAAFGVPDGTPGECVSSNTGLFNTPGGGATADAYPAEIVNVFPVGGASSTLSASSTLNSGATGAGTSQAPAARGTRSTWGAIKALYRQ